MGFVDIAGYQPKHLSYSTVSAYRMCPKKFYFDKVARLEERPGVASLAGNAVHTGTEWLDLAEFLGLPLEEVIRDEVDKHRQAKEEYKNRQEGAV